VNELGFIGTPYRKVRNGKVTEEIEYLSADKEDAFIIAQANEPIDDKNFFENAKVKARFKGDFPIIAREDVDFMDVAY